MKGACLLLEYVVGRVMAPQTMFMPQSLGPVKLHGRGESRLWVELRWQIS